MRWIQTLRNATWARWPLGAKQLAILLPLVFVAGLPTILWLRESAEREEQNLTSIARQATLIARDKLSNVVQSSLAISDESTLQRQISAVLDEISIANARLHDQDTASGILNVSVCVAMIQESAPNSPSPKDPATSASTPRRDRNPAASEGPEEDIPTAATTNPSRVPSQPIEPLDAISRRSPDSTSTSHLNQETNPFEGLVEDIESVLSSPVKAVGPPSFEQVASPNTPSSQRRYTLTTDFGTATVVVASDDLFSETEEWERNIVHVIEHKLEEINEDGGELEQSLTDKPIQLDGRLWVAQRFMATRDVVREGLDPEYLMVAAIDPGQQATSNFVYISLVATGVVLIGALVLLLQKVVVSPIRTLSRTMERIAREADYDTPVTIDRDDEVGRLQRGLSTMLATIHEQIDRIQTLNAELQEEKELLEQRVAHRTEALERSNQELDSFAYSVSHDLQEPLRNITHIVEEVQFDWYKKHHPQIEEQLTSILAELKTFDSRLEKARAANGSADGPTNGKLRQLQDDVHGVLDTWNDSVSTGLQEHLDAISKQCERERQMVQRILQISRVGRGIRPVAVDLNNAVASAQEVLASRLDESGLQVRCRQTLPTIMGDPTLIHQVFMNLISNASRYNDKDEKWVEISSRCGDGDTLCEIRVRDNGIGIRDKDRNKVFKIFQQLHSTRKFGKGIGAGLTIVQKIIHYHGGTIDFESEYGVGTTFIFTLPRYQETTDASDDRPPDSDR